MPRHIAIPLCAYGFWLNAKKMKIALTAISRLFSRGNARFVYHLVGLAKGHETPHRDPNFCFQFSLATHPKILGDWR